jgi:hypothetical protein
MGLLKDTYNITKIDMSGIEYQMKRKNDIQKQQNIIINNTKDRVDISLREYEDLKNELKSKTELLNKYDEFITELAKSIKLSPEILLKGKVVKSEFERVPYTMSHNLYVVWEYKDRDLESKGE